MGGGALTVTGADDKSWCTLFKAGGIAAILMITITLAQFVVFVAAPPPLESTAAAWFTMFQQNALSGLLAFELLLVIYMLLSVPVALALYVALRRVNPGLTAIYVSLSLIGVAAFIMSRPAFEMLYLSNLYAAAATGTEKVMYLAAGNAMVALFHGTAFQLSYIIGSVSGLVISAVILQSKVFSKTTAYIRMGSSILDFGLYIPGIGLYLSLLSVMLLLIFDILIARRLLQLGKGNVHRYGQPEQQDKSSPHAS